MTNILYFRTYRSYGHFPYKIVDHVTRSILLWCVAINAQSKNNNFTSRKLLEYVHVPFLFVMNFDQCSCSHVKKLLSQLLLSLRVRVSIRKSTYNTKHREILKRQFHKFIEPGIDRANMVLKHFAGFYLLT